MREQLPNQRRFTYQFERGNWMAKGDIVSAGTPAAFPPLAADGSADRLAMARWFVSGKHPLTARVFVNRIWEQLFGTGIVETTGDFGASGAKPTHPELLDYLALKFQREHSWHFKKLLREIVLSVTYRQDSHASSKLVSLDPSNRLLARGPRQRLSAEMVRDQALALSGLLAKKMHGPPVMPRQPEGVWRTVYNGSKWELSAGEDQYRRAVYIFWKRTSGYPSMLTFDAPSRDVCSVRRIPTNTPLQALVTLNDPALFECAEGLGKRMMNEGGDTPSEQIAWAHRQVTNADVSPKSLRILRALYDHCVDRYQSADERFHERAHTSSQFALIMVAHAILNLDEALTR